MSEPTTPPAGRTKLWRVVAGSADIAGVSRNVGGNIVSNIGTLMQSVGAAWLMTLLTSSTTLVGLVQTAATLPVFLVGLLAGALADLADRKSLLLWSQLWMLVMAATLGLLTLFGLTSPWVLLALTFCLGLGGAISLPTWQATVQDMVPKAWVASAVSLNSIAFNVARAIGPALGWLCCRHAGRGRSLFCECRLFSCRCRGRSFLEEAACGPHATERRCFWSDPGGFSIPAARAPTAGADYSRHRL